MQKFFKADVWGMVARLTGYPGRWTTLLTGLINENYLQRPVKVGIYNIYDDEYLG